MEDQEQQVNPSEELSLFCCQNDRCLAFGVRGLGNLKVRGRVGERQARLLYCTTCKKRFVETKGTVFYRAHKPREQVISIR